MTHPIQAWRDKASFQAGAFATAVGVSYRTLHRIERGEVAVSLRVAEAVHRVTGGAITAKDLVAYEQARKEARARAEAETKGAA